MGAKVAVPESVDAFFASFEHPHRDAFLRLREIILSVDAGIAEGIKWNVPSFRTGEYFATLHVRAKTGVAVILHFGAKKRDMKAARASIDDSDALLEWLGDDRAIAAFRDLAHLDDMRDAFAHVIRQWIVHV